MKMEKLQKFLNKDLIEYIDIWWLGKCEIRWRNADGRIWKGTLKELVSFHILSPVNNMKTKAWRRKYYNFK